MVQGTDGVRERDERGGVIVAGEGGGVVARNTVLSVLSCCKGRLGRSKAWSLACSSEWKKREGKSKCKDANLQKKL